MKSGLDEPERILSMVMHMEEALFLGTETEMCTETFMLMIPSVRLSKSLHSCFAM